LATKKGSLIFHSIGLTHLPLSTPATLENMHILIPNPNSIIPSVYLHPDTDSNLPLLNRL